MFVGSYFYGTVYVIEYKSTIPMKKLPMTVIFIFLFDGNLMNADDNLFKLVDIKQLSSNVNGIIMDLQHAPVIGR